MKAVTAAPTAAMALLPSQPSRLSSPHGDHSSSSYPSLTAPQSSPLPGRAHSTFVRLVSASSDAFPVLPGQIPAPRSPQHNTLTHYTGFPSSLLQQPSLSPSRACYTETIPVQSLAPSEILLENAPPPVGSGGYPSRPPANIFFACR
jgi:hypothetical protein